eukprot:6228125-Prymnesium_polylepis.1
MTRVNPSEPSTAERRMRRQTTDGSVRDRAEIAGGRGGFAACRPTAVTKRSGGQSFLLDSDGNRLIRPRTSRVPIVAAHAKLKDAGLHHLDDDAVSDRLHVVELCPHADFIAVAAQHHVLHVDELSRADAVKPDEHTADKAVRRSVRRHKRTVGKDALARLDDMHRTIRCLKKPRRCRTHAIQVVERSAILFLRKLDLVFKKESVVVVERIVFGDLFEDTVVRNDGRRHQGAVIRLGQPHQILPRVKSVELRLIEDTGCQRVLLNVAAVQAFLQGSFRNQSIDSHWFELPYAPRAGDGLVVVDWVPREIGDDDMVRAGQADADAPRLSGEVDDAPVLVKLVE